MLWRKRTNRAVKLRLWLVLQLRMMFVQLPSHQGMDLTALKDDVILSVYVCSWLCVPVSPHRRGGVRRYI